MKQLDPDAPISWRDTNGMLNPIGTLTTRTRNTLSHLEYYADWDPPNPKTARTWREITAWSSAELLRIPNFGKVSLVELKTFLTEHGLALVGDLDKDYLEKEAVQLDHITRRLRSAESGVPGSPRMNEINSIIDTLSDTARRLRSLD
jgi:hypothetical protein